MSREQGPCEQSDAGMRPAAIAAGHRLDLLLSMSIGSEVAA